jgi:PilZ domain
MLILAKVEKPRDPRFKPQQTVAVTLMGPRPRLMRMTVLNLSDDGIGLRSAVPLSVGSVMELDFNGRHVRATVNRCNPDGGSCLIGASIGCAPQKPHPSCKAIDSRRTFEVRC